MIYDVEHHFMFICHVYIFLARCLLMFLTHFLMGCYLIVEFLATCIFWIIVLYQICLLQIFSTNLWLVFSISWQCPLQSRKLKFQQSPAYGLLSQTVLLVLFLKTSLNPNSSKFSLMSISRSFTVLHLKFSYQIHFELIFVKGIRWIYRCIFFACGYPDITAPLT